MILKILDSSKKHTFLGEKNAKTVYIVSVCLLIKGRENICKKPSDLFLNSR
jgi:hypothetical protein